MKNQVFIFLGIVSFYLASCSGNNSSSATSRKDSTETVDTIHQDTTARDSTASKSLADSTTNAPRMPGN
jgi:hypothetical protein